MSKSGSGVIRSPGDIPRAAGGGKMYNDGRNAQNILSYDRADGYAINAWSGGNGLEGWSSWYSGIVDDGRNVKGDPAIYAYYTRPLQVVIQRKVKKNDVGGKTFDTSGKPAFTLKLINQGLLPKGEYTLQLKLKDGAGNYHDTYNYTTTVNVEGGHVYAQDIDTNYVFTLNNSLRGGFITLEGALYDRDNRQVTDGAEQILLSNRRSFKDCFKGLTGEVYGWPAARKALEEAEAQVADFTPAQASHYIVAAAIPDEATLQAMLSKVKDGGATLLIKCDSAWALTLKAKGILSAEATEWGAKQVGFWNGNGFGYIDYFVGNTGIVSPYTISTTAWEAPGDPNGFYPFESDYPTHVYGVYVARPDLIRTLIGVVDYGKGQIVLDPTYPVDDNHPLNDLLFYNILTLHRK
jgi:hypothetical protein